jgi:serine/threonine protein phosphatase 1
MATIAIGDIHGNAPALDDVLGQVRNEAGREDTVVFLGDYIDRGPDTRACIDALLRFRSDISARVVCLCGNHEDWMLRTLADPCSHSWLMGMEALDTIRSYSGDAEFAIREAMFSAGLELYVAKRPLPYDLFFASLPEAHRLFFQELVVACETPDCVCVHGGLDPHVARLDEQARDAVIWGTRNFQEEYAGEKPVVYGHWNNADVDSTGWPSPRSIGRTIGIDTIAHGVLTAIRLPDLRLFQSSRYDAHR